MAFTAMQQEVGPRADETFSSADALGTTFQLSNRDESEVLTFLAERPIHTVFMAGLIRDNGLNNELNRGIFYANRGQNGKLDGVALIGHATLVEARSNACLTAFAKIAKEHSSPRLIRGEREAVRSFWRNYSALGQSPRLVCGEVMMEQRAAFQLGDTVPKLRLATPDDLNHVIAANCDLAIQEAGCNPLQKDPEGFRQRSLRRIEQGRVWVWLDNNKLMFKADVLADTSNATYLEGVCVHPQERSKGYGIRCLTQLGRLLLAKSDLICLTVNTKVSSAMSFYCKAGYRLHSYYETIYLQ